MFEVFALATGWIALALLATALANRFFLPKHLLAAPAGTQVPSKQFDEEDDEEE
jgi:hypothetical protein